jgi:hypothetical protein
MIIFKTIPVTGHRDCLKNCCSRIVASISFIFVVNNCFAQGKTPAVLKTDFDKQYQDVSSYAKKNKISVDKKNAMNVNVIGNSLKDLLIESETPTAFDKEIAPRTRELLSTKNDPYTLVLIQRAITEDTALDNRLHLKEKLLRELGIRISLLTKYQYPYYNYASKEKQAILFISIRSGNDLFTLTGLYDLFFLSANKHIKDGGTFFQRNDDRDYTGSFLIEIGTDYLKTLRKRPLKTY